MGLETMTVSAECLQVRRVIVVSVCINMINVKLAYMYWLEPTVFTVVFLVDYVWGS
jgi:hypothetical protein